MISTIVLSSEIVTLLGASTPSEAVINESRALAPRVVAADGGAVVALDHGVMPEAVIGDFDSLPENIRMRIPKERLHPVAEQDSTDFDKALTRIDAPLVLAVGFTGRRLDHEMAVYNALVRNADRRAIVIGDEDICFHLPAQITMPLPVGSRFSLFPMTEVQVASRGLKWPTDGLVFSPWGRVGTSNQVIAPEVEVTPAADGMLVILPRAALIPAIAALVPGWQAARGR